MEMEEEEEGEAWRMELLWVNIVCKNDGCEALGLVKR